MLNETLNFLFQRDLIRLVREIDSFKQKENIWKTTEGISNSAGNLSLHLLGNLNHFIGHVLGKSDYKRDREFEFNGKNVNKEEIIQSIEQLQQTLDSYFSQASINQYQETYPIQVFDRPYSTEEMLIHLSGHLNYHLGQINYLRRVLESA